MNETRDRFGWPRELDPLDPLARFPSESETGTSSSSSAARTVSVIADLPPEWQSLALEPRTAAAQHPTFVRAEAHRPAPRESVVSSTRSGTSLWVMLRTLPPSARWITSLAVLVPSLATLVLRTQLLSTAAPLDPVQDAAAVGTVRPVESQTDAQLATQPPLVTAPGDTNDEFVISTPKEPSPARGARQPALTSPPQQTTAHVAQPPPRSSPPDGGAVQISAAAQSAPPVGVDVIVADDDKATRSVAPVPGRKTSSDRLTFRGAISVESQPAGAQVSIDGRPVGVTPLADWELAAGSHVVRIDLDGYERWSTAIQVVTDKTVNVVTNLQPTRHD